MNAQTKYGQDEGDTECPLACSLRGDELAQFAAFVGRSGTFHCSDGGLKQVTLDFAQAVVPLLKRHLRKGSLTIPQSSALKEPFKKPVAAFFDLICTIVQQLHLERNEKDLSADLRELPLLHLRVTPSADDGEQPQPDGIVMLDDTTDVGTAPPTNAFQSDSIEGFVDIDTCYSHMYKLAASFAGRIFVSQPERHFVFALFYNYKNLTLWLTVLVPQGCFIHH
ncbi:hypothetical protein BDQ12DRAFT_164590 [Crucibulum laeve]|uniref:Uncharacterized protein n=1 Tax=Crucibulum laeve TaxID=68775 RepID=A0A5C3MEJ1_9AGAR|nr:hypothetical protein BDQ12DRAFT_164590 [Crucibulum laeve]